MQQSHPGREDYAITKDYLLAAQENPRIQSSKKQQELLGNPQPKSSFNDVSTFHNLAQAQASIT